MAQCGEGKIGGVRYKKLVTHTDDRGTLVEVLRQDDPFFEAIRQTTYTEAYPGVIKAFHWHQRQKDMWFFSAGMAQVVLYDLREGSKTRGTTEVYFMGVHNPLLLCIPEGVAHGYRVLGPTRASLFYHTTDVYDPARPDEERIPFDDPSIGFDWRTRNR